MSVATLEAAITAVAGLWEPSTFPKTFHENEYLRGQIELIADTFELPEEYQDDATKPYIYRLIAEKLGINEDIDIPEDMETEWEILVNLHESMTKEEFESDSNSYTYGQLEYFVVLARRLFDFDHITGDSIPALKTRLGREAGITA